MADASASPAGPSTHPQPTASPAAAAPSTATNTSTVNAANMSLQDLKKQHQANLAVLKANSQRAHAKLAQSAANCAVLSARDANAQLQEVFHNEQQLEQQIKELAAQSEHFKKRVQQWGGHFLKLNQAMKEIGDVHNWSQSIHKDIDATLTILDEVSAKKRRVLGLGGSEAATASTE